MKKSADQEPVSPEDEAAAARKPQRTARAALAMRVAGASDVEIAQMLDYASPSHARAAWENAMASTIDAGSDLKALRGLATARLEAGMKAHANLALNEYISVPDPNDPEGKRRIKVKNEEQIGHSMMFFRYVDRWTKLKGLDAPQVMALVTPDAIAFEQVVNTMTALARKGDAEEADIFEEREDGTFEQVPDGEDDDGTA